LASISECSNILPGEFDFGIYRCPFTATLDRGQARPYSFHKIWYVIQISELVNI